MSAEARIYNGSGIQPRDDIPVKRSARTALRRLERGAHINRTRGTA